MRPTWADIDLGAVSHNVEALAKLVHPIDVCVVVKADGYGHGAVPVGRAAIEAGASWLAVALVEEGRELRDAGIRKPILVLSEPRPMEMVEVVAYDLTPTVYSGQGLAAAAAAAAQATMRLDVHLLVDTGMGRVGVHPADAASRASAIADKDSLNLAGVWTHCAVADELNNPYTDGQLRTYESVLAQLGSEGHQIRWRHAANSAVTMAHPSGRYDMVRCGIAAYGVAPARALEGFVDLIPALTLRSEISYVKRVPAGERISYGLRWQAQRDTTIATVPIGYADGVRRRSSEVGAEVLIGGRRCPIVGNVTMDQLMVDCGDSPVSAGDEVVLIGRQGTEEITAMDCADRLDTIPYDIVCDIRVRVSRRYT